MNMKMDLKLHSRRNIILAVILALMVIAVAAGIGLRSCAQSGKYERYYDRAEAAYRDGDWDKARDNLEKAMDIDATEQCYLLLAEVYYKGYGDIDKAIDTLYVGSFKLGSEAIARRLEELKAERTGDDGEDEVEIGGVKVKPDATTLSLAKLGLYDSDLEGIAGLHELENLTLTENRLTSLSFITGLTKLESLYASDNMIGDISPLAAMTQLKNLYLDNNPITDFTALYGLKSLKTLSIKGIDITVSQLEELKKQLPQCSIFSDEAEDEVVEITLGGVTFRSDVEELDLGGKGITDISELAKCKNLKKLDLRDNKAADLTPLAGLTELEWLCLWNNGISDVRPLMSLTKLTYLDLDVNRVSDIGTLASLPELSELWLSYNPIGSVQPLGQLKKLTRLGLKGLNLKDGDLDAVAGLSGLQELLLDENKELSGERVDELKKSLPGCTISTSELLYTFKCGSNEFKSDAAEISGGSCGVSDIRALDKFTKLTKLLLPDNSISDISALASCTQLVTLDLSGNKITDITALASCQHLQTLLLSNNSIASLSPFSGLISLHELHLDNCKPGDITPLSRLTGLVKLSLSYCSLEDISALSSLINLDYLDLEGNNISDTEPLKSLKSLTVLNITNNNFTSTQISQLMQALPNCQILTDIPVDDTPPVHTD